MGRAPANLFSITHRYADGNVAQLSDLVMDRHLELLSTVTRFVHSDEIQYRANPTISNPGCGVIEVIPLNGTLPNYALCRWFSLVKRQA